MCIIVYVLPNYVDLAEVSILLIRLVTLSHYNHIDQQKCTQA